MTRLGGRRRGASAPHDTAASRWRRRAPGGFATLLLAAGCAAASREPPGRPGLPAVNFVPPCDSRAAVALTPDGVESLKARDAAWRAHVELLEAVIRGASTGQ